ncbi:MAG: SGNH/GDSL hydrolase family protein [Clostridia bacterium]|nr:SGNH/GDSL hydrolase family protein [Clostridia bacterium]
MKRILFQGDSITDAHRSRDNDEFPGSGYPNLLKAKIGLDYPNDYESLNRGVSGDRVVDIYARIRRDIIMLKPDILSILIGINDVWHELGSHNGVDAKKFEMVYDLILSEVKAALPEIKILILEPFVLCGSATENTEQLPDRYDYFRSETLLRAKAAKRVSEKHGATFVPLQDAFDEAATTAPARHWLMDGVHPTSAGHELIARAWLEHIQL